MDGGFINSRLSAFGAALVTPVLLEFGALKWLLERLLDCKDTGRSGVCNVVIACHHPYKNSECLRLLVGLYPSA